MNIYTAARYGDMEQMRKVRDRLHALGHTVTARWIDGGEEGPNGRTLEQAAVMDVVDVSRSDVLLFFSQPYGSANTGGGRHWELGYAYALRKRCIVIGPKEIVFHHLSNIEVYDSLDDACEKVFGLVQQTQTTTDNPVRAGKLPDHAGKMNPDVPKSDNRSVSETEW